MMALRSVWVGGVCNFTLVKKTRIFKLPLCEKKKEEKPTVFARVRVCVSCACVSKGCSEAS